MPSTIVKLCTSDARAWANNQPLWLRESGETARPVTRSEQEAISRALERTRHIQHSFRLDLPLHDVRAGRHGMGVRSQPSLGRPLPGATAGSVQVMRTAFEVTYVGKARSVTVWNGDLRYAQGRDVLKARLLAEHGECMLHGVNGKCMGVLRDPLVASRPPREGKRYVISRNPNDAARVSIPTASGVSSVRQNHRPRNPARPVYSPAQCPNDCRGLRGPKNGGGHEWALAKDARPPTADEHHPICKFAPAWAETLDHVEANEVLFDLDFGRVARDAMPNEVAEADESEKLTGVRQVTVAGRLFALLPKAEAAQAALEARGEGADESDTNAEIDPLLVLPVSNPTDREAWPDLDALRAAPETYRQRAEVTAATYLARSAPTGAPPGAPPGAPAGPPSAPPEQAGHQP